MSDDEKVELSDLLDAMRDGILYTNLVASKAHYMLYKLMMASDIDDVRRADLLKTDKELDELVERADHYISQLENKMGRYLSDHPLSF